MGSAPIVSLSTDTFTFSSQTVGTTSTAQTVTVHNIGNANLTFGTISSTNGDFAIQTNTCTTAVAAGSSCTVSVTFTPSAPGDRQGILMIPDNAAGSPQDVNMAGIGTAAAPAVTLSPTSLVFTSQPVSVTSPQQPVTLKNTGAGP